MAKSRPGKATDKKQNPNKKKFQSQTFFKAAMRKPKDEEIEIYCRWYNLAAAVTRKKLDYGVLKLEKFWEKWNAMPEWVQKNLVNPDSLEGVRRTLYEDNDPLQTAIDSVEQSAASWREYQSGLNAGRARLAQAQEECRQQAVLAQAQEEQRRQQAVLMGRRLGGPDWRGVMGMNSSDMANYLADPTRNFISGESSMVTAQQMQTPYASIVGSNRNVGLVARHFSIDPNMILDQVRMGTITRSEFASALERVYRETGQAPDPIYGQATITASSAPQKPQAQPYQPGQKILDYVEKQLETEYDQERRKWLMAFKLCILPDHVRDVIEEAITVVLCKSKFDTWGFNETFEKGLTNSILIYGPPGTGKTMVTESIAAILGQKLLKLTTGDLQSQIPGEMERNIKQNFEQAASQKAVIMLDECDSLLYDRGQVGAILASEINALLGAIENFSGVVVLTTNRLGVLDPALQRRIIAKVKLDPPGLEERKQIWKNLIPAKMPLCETVNTEAYAAHELTGGEIKNAVLLAARRAIARNVDKVTHDHFEHGITTILEGKRDYEANRPKDIRELDYRRPKADMGVSMGAGKDLVRGIDRTLDLTRTSGLIKERKASCS